MKSVIFAIAVVCVMGGCTQSLSVDKLSCEYLTCPSGIDMEFPRFSWIIDGGGERGVYQQAYRVVVSDKADELRSKTGNCWDSGWANSDNSINVEYAGQPLVGNQAYYWRVGVKVNGSEIWSKPASFRTGLLRQDEWKAQWLSTKEKIRQESPLFRKTFTIGKNVREAYVYSTAAGIYGLYLNGERVGDEVLNPSVSDYRKTVLYSVYDVTTMLHTGTNAFGVMLGNGAYNMQKEEGRYCWDGTQLGNPCFALQMYVTYEDGSNELLTSGEGWKYTAGPVSFNNIYGGEDYNAQKEIDGWATADIDDSSWKEAAVVPNPGGKVKWQSIPIRITETLTPVASTRPSEKTYLYDLGQNIAGWWRITVKGAAGQTLRIRGTETLNNQQFPKNLEEGDTFSDRNDYHRNVWTDYTLKGSEEEVFEPRFFYTGFRYVEVAVSDGAALAALKVEGRIVRSDVEPNGEFTSSNELLNQIHKIGVWAQMGNLVGYPTDCPHREKGAYNGDGQVEAEASMHDFRMASFYAKWLNDMRDSQEPDGRIPNTSPPIVGGMGGGVGWGSAYVLLPWWMYNYYGDTQILKEHYPTMKRYIAYLRNKARTDSKPEQPYIINYFEDFWYSLGEWCSPGRGDCPNHDVVNTFYYCYDTQLMSQIADMLGHPDDAKQYALLCDTIKQAFNKQFLREETALYGLDSTFQTYQLLALAGDLAPDSYKERVMQTIVDDIQKRNNHLNTGMIGTKFLWGQLVEAGYADLAYAVATQETYPSYGYWIRNNSTTLLEDWQGGNSHNHQMFGSVTEFFYKYLAGIQSPLEGRTTPGYKHIHLQPCMPDGLRSAEASLNTVSGKIVAGWERQEGQYSFHGVIPANTTATLVLPAGGLQQLKVTESGKNVWENATFVNGSKGIRNADISGDKLTISLESGEYWFVVSE